MSNDVESPKTKSIRKRRCSERRHGEPPLEKKEPKAQKLIQAETAETGQASSSQPSSSGGSGVGHNSSIIGLVSKLFRGASFSILYFY